MSGLQGRQYQSVISQTAPFQLFLCPPFVCIIRGYDLERQLWRSMAILWLFMSKFVPYKIINMLTLSSFCRGLSAYWVLFSNFIIKIIMGRLVLKNNSKCHLRRFLNIYLLCHKPSFLLLGL